MHQSMLVAGQPGSWRHRIRTADFRRADITRCLAGANPPFATDPSNVQFQGTLFA